MSELRITGLQAGQQTTAQNPTRKGEPKQKNRVILFSSLPENMRTESVRDFYDKDHNGFLDSCNSDGKNEVAFMEQVFGVDLSKYYNPDIVRTECVEGANGYMHYYGYNAQGDRIIEIGDDGRRFIVETICENGTEKIMEYDNLDYKNGYLTQISDMGSDVNRHVTRYYDDGYITQSSFFDEDCECRRVKLSVYNYKREKICDDICEGGEKTRNLTTGDAQLVEHKVLETIEPYRFTSSAFEAIRFAEKHYITYFTLNGEEVEIKAIGKGRYEVTDKNGIIFYVSHDGKYLNPEYVKNNTEQ